MRLMESSRHPGPQATLAQTVQQAKPGQEAPANAQSVPRARRVLLVLPHVKTVGLTHTAFWGQQPAPTALKAKRALQVPKIARRRAPGHKRTGTVAVETIGPTPTKNGAALKTTAGTARRTTLRRRAARSARLNPFAAPTIVKKAQMPAISRSAVCSRRATQETEVGTAIAG